MEQDVYPIVIDEATGRAYVRLTGEISPQRIRDTFLAISFNQDWIRGDRSILYLLEDARFPKTFEFSAILKNIKSLEGLVKNGKSAVVIEKDSVMQEQVSGFYVSLSCTITERKLRVFDTTEEAEAWLDSKNGE